MVVVAAGPVHRATCAPQCLRLPAVPATGLAGPRRPFPPPTMVPGFGAIRCWPTARIAPFSTCRPVCYRTRRTPSVACGSAAPGPAFAEPTCPPRFCDRGKAPSWPPPERGPAVWMYRLAYHIPRPLAGLSRHPSLPRTLTPAPTIGTFSGHFGTSSGHMNRTGGYRAQRCGRVRDVSGHFRDTFGTDRISLAEGSEDHPPKKSWATTCRSGSGSVCSTFRSPPPVGTTPGTSGAPRSAR